MTALILCLLALDEVTDLLARLRATSDPVQMYQIENSLQQAVRPAHVPLLVREIETGAPAARPHLIRVLGRAGSKDAQAALRALLGKHEMASRAEAAYALKLLDDESGMKMLVGLLPKAQTTEDKQAILQKLYAYYVTGPEVVAALVRFLETEREDLLRRMAIYSLASHKHPAGEAALRKMAEDEKDPHRWEALATIVRSGDEAAVERGLKALEEGKVPASAASILLNAIENAGQKALVPRLRDLLEKAADSSLRAALIRSLVSLKDEKLLGLLGKYAEEADLVVSSAATEGILQLAGRSQVDLIKKIAGQGNTMHRLRAAEALLALDLPDGLEILKEELGNAIWSYRLQAVYALGRARRREAVDLLLAAMDDGEERVRSQARTTVVGSLSALYPYLRFDPNASPEKLKAWWAKNRPK